MSVTLLFTVLYTTTKETSSLKIYKICSLFPILEYHGKKFIFLMQLDQPYIIDSICTYIYNCFKRWEEVELVNTGMY